MSKHILLLNGPNLNLLGLREPHLYGATTLPALVSSLSTFCTTRSPPVRLSSFQSNSEAALLDVIQAVLPSAYTFVPPPASSSASNPSSAAPPVRKEGVNEYQEPDTTEVRREGEADEEESRGDISQVDAIVINAAGLTHTSVVLRDALTAVGLPFIEVHITNTHAREDFRHASFLCDKAVGVVCGLGVFGYRAAVEYFITGGSLPS